MKQNINWRNHLGTATILLLSMMGMGIIVFSTAWAPWVYSDSVAYLLSALNLLQGNGLGVFGASGLFHSLSLNPPFYPLVISVIGLTGIDLVDGVRWLNVIFFGLTIGLVGASLAEKHRFSFFSICGAILFLISPIYINLYSGAMSEVPFIFLGILGLWMLLIYLEDQRIWALIISAVAVSLAFLTRYVGIAYIVTGVTVILIGSRHPWRRRLLDGVCYAMFTVLPMIGWLIWLSSQTHTLVPRSLMYDFANLPKQAFLMMVTMLLAVWNWFPFLPSIPYRLKFVILFVVLLLFGATLFLANRRIMKEDRHPWKEDAELRLLLVFAVFMVAYFSALAFSYLFTKPIPDLDARILSPAYLAFLIVLLGGLRRWACVWSAKKWLLALPIAFILIFTVSSAPSTVKMVKEFHLSGGGYTGVFWRQSPTLKAIQSIPTSISIISNESAAVYFLIGRPCYAISELSGPVSNTSSRYGDDLSDNSQKVFREQGGALVLFASFRWQLEPIYGQEAVQRMAAMTEGLALYGEYGDGSIYFYP